jgi:hypothetical protein
MASTGLEADNQFMTKTTRLPLASPVAMQGTARGIWVADRDSRSLVSFAAADATQVRTISLAEAPVAMAAAEGFVATALASGNVVAFETATGTEVWRRSLGATQLKSGTNHIWVVVHDGDALVSFDRSGAGSRVRAENVREFAALPDGVVWLSDDGVLIAHNVLESSPRTLLLPEGVTASGLAACANAVWVSIDKGLLLVDQYEFQLRSTLAAPEGPVPHLLCSDGKLVGGLNGVFVLNPMTDARVHLLPVQPQSQLAGIAASAEVAWALESAQPVVHITSLF